jgi:hypothetical protein
MTNRSSDSLLAYVRLLFRSGTVSTGTALELRHVRNLQLGRVIVRDAVVCQERRDLRGRV